jgi:hypothetical protein
MLHPDSDRRIKEMTKMADLFKEKGYDRTANKILEFAEIQKEKDVPSDFMKKLDDVFDLFQTEFEKLLPVGQDYRKRCFEEIKSIVFKAIGRMHPAFAQAILKIHPSLKRLNHGRRITGEIADELSRKQIKDENVLFHLYCFAYLIMVEGIFDELARVLFFFLVVENKRIPTPQELRKMNVWKILREFKPTPVFLENWPEKKNIRNAIGHATVFYDSLKKEARFIDEIAGYDKILSLNQFMEMGLQLDDSVAAFTYIIILLKLYDFIMSKNPFV